MAELPALYLPLAPGGGHRFQERLRRFVAEAPKGGVLLLHAPTGAGKTHAILQLARRVEGVLLCVPTNALASEVVQTAEREMGLRVARWNADAFPKKGLERHRSMLEETLNDLVVANPDMMHLFAQHEDVPERFRVTPASFGMKNFGLVVFDEYHAYDERLLASILLHVLRSRHARDNPQRFVFMTATPDEALPAALDALGIPHDVEPLEAATPTPLPPDQGRMIKGPLRVDVLDTPILDSLPHEAPARRTLFVFSTYLRQQQAVRLMRSRGIPEGDAPGAFVQITGRKTGSSLGQDAWGNASLLLATSKVDVGLNVPDLHEVVMEPGWREQQFWQRFGRAGRGRPGRVVLHFEDHPEETLAPLRKAASYDELARGVRALLRPDTHHVTTILRFVGAYAAVYRDRLPDSHDRDALHPDALPPTARQAHGLVHSILHRAASDPLRDRRGGSLEWSSLVRWTLRGLRGRSLKVPAEYDWSPGETVQEDLVYVRTRSQATEPSRRGEPWRIHEFLPRPRDARLHYRILDGETVAVPTRGTLRRDAFRRVPQVLEERVRDELDDALTPFWDALLAWLRMVPPDEIPPVEVEPDDVFL